MSRGFESHALRSIRVKPGYTGKLGENSIGI